MTGMVIIGWVWWVAFWLAFLPDGAPPRRSAEIIDLATERARRAG